MDPVTKMIWLKATTTNVLSEKNHKAKNIHSNWPSKKLDQKKYGPFKISKDIGQGVFQLELLER